MEDQGGGEAQRAIDPKNKDLKDKVDNEGSLWAMYVQSGELALLGCKGSLGLKWPVRGYVCPEGSIGLL
jgi:hypothetical protein